MNLSKTSWYYKLCKEAYGMEFKSICSLFWATFFGLFLFVIGYTFCLPYLLAHYIFEKEMCRKPILYSRIVGAIMTYFLLFWVFCMIGMFFYWNQKGLEGIVTWGCGGWLITLCFLFMYLKEQAKDYELGAKIRVKLGLPPKEEILIQEKKPNIFWEFIKAKKKKACPIITWNEQ